MLTGYMEWNEAGIKAQQLISAGVSRNMWKTLQQYGVLSPNLGKIFNGYLHNNEKLNPSLPRQEGVR
ncbi:hypothetical protein C5167_035615 [Papaver somniferum]|uniref:Uncharacterized protein n=1 Tax=Papaver somniferum TaxID=3469 RepID=A0A4Y7KJM3_PAPSO|nr:hypothetical protein C5167_035615 [Papaver somniferum]